MDWFKKLFNTYFGKDKLITNLAVILIIGVMLLIVGGSFFSNKKNDIDIDATIQKQNTAEISDSEDTYGEKMERKLEAILSQIEGVGDVSVMITFYSGTEIVPAIDEKRAETITEEKDTQGGSRKITQKEKDDRVLLMNGQGGNEQPLILKEIKPLVKGVIIAAEGASNIQIKSYISEAVQIALSVPAHKVQVFKKQVMKDK